MTPRSRKPVIIGAMLGIATDNYRKTFMSLPEDDDELLSRSSDQILNTSLCKSKSEGDLVGLQSPSDTLEGISGDTSESFKKVSSEETLSTPFR